jgi:hypothetical protein
LSVSDRVGPKNWVMASGGPTGVDVDALPARRGVHTYYWVYGFDWLATDWYARCSRTICLGDGAMQGGQTFEVDLQTRAERRVESVARAPERVAAGLGTSEQLQRGGARWLELVRNV